MALQGSDPGGNPPPSVVHDPVVLLVYELMRRGSVLPATMGQIIGNINRNEVDLEEAPRLVREAAALCRLLPWYGGA